MGTVTAVGWRRGVVREVDVGRFPAVFGGNTQSAACALIASGTLLLVQYSGYPQVRLIVATAVGPCCACSRAGAAGYCRNTSPGDDRTASGIAGGGRVMVTTSRSASVLTGLGGIRGWQEELYRDLHQHPELAHQEHHHTAGIVAGRLRAAGFSVHEGIGGTGVIGVRANGDGSAVLLRADMDALPIREATGLPYASTVTVADAAGDEVPVMHACGHDVHVACLLGAAQLLADAAEHTDVVGGAIEGSSTAVFRRLHRWAKSDSRMRATAAGTSTVAATVASFDLGQRPEPIRRALSNHVE